MMNAALIESEFRHMLDILGGNDTAIAITLHRSPNIEEDFFCIFAHNKTGDCISMKTLDELDEYLSKQELIALKRG